MSGLYGFTREAVRVKVKKHEGALPQESRKFSVDPQITSFEVLQSILAKAFDVKEEFTICYMVYDANGCETYLPLLTDWELEAAFLKAYNLSVASRTEPCLCLRVDLKPFEVSSEVWEIQSSIPVITHIRSGNASEVKSNQRLHGLFNQVGKTLNLMQRAFNFGEDGAANQQPPRLPLSDSEFRNFLNSVGQIIHAKELRNVIYLGGIEPSLRTLCFELPQSFPEPGEDSPDDTQYPARQEEEYKQENIHPQNTNTMTILLKRLGNCFIAGGNYNAKNPYWGSRITTTKKRQLLQVTTNNRRTGKKVVWKHLLNVYPDGMTGRERMDYIKKKAAEYVAMKDVWKAAVATGPVVGELAYTTGMVKKDVLRTDRHHPFYAGSDDNQNIASLFNILTTYALNHPKVSYCQGMSDLASPLLVTMGDEAHAYICFCALMSRLSTNFMLDGIAMTQKFTHLAEGLQHYDPDFYNYLKLHQADDLLFCYRWLLLEMKREFAFDDSLRMLEVLWSSLPALPPTIELKLLDVQFQPPPTISPPISPLVKTPRENAYTKVCALRRQSSSISLASYSGGKKVPSVKRQNHSLDETIGRCTISDLKIKHQSLDDAALIKQKARDNNGDVYMNSGRFEMIKNEEKQLSPGYQKSELRPRSVSPLEQKSDSVILNNRINHHKNVIKTRSSSLSSSMTNLIKSTKKSGHFKDLKEKIGLFSSLDALDGTHDAIQEEPESKPKGKMVKNLNEFLNFAAGNKCKIADKLRISSVGGGGDSSSERPKIMLTKSSFDDSESSSFDRNSNKPRHLSSTSTNSYDDTFDECSPDDSQEYFPMTTSVTREFRIELENLDRQVFGNNFHAKLLDSESPKTKCDEECFEILDDVNPPVAAKSKKTTNDKRCLGKTTDDIFVWENPLHKSSPNVAIKAIVNVNTPDEQADLDYEAELVDESSKTITPIKILNNARLVVKSSDDSKTISDNAVQTSNKIECKPEMAAAANVNNLENSQYITNSCEEIAEAAKPSSNNKLPPPKEFGGGNAFLMFLCITVLLQHREQIIGAGMDYNEMAMHFDKMVRKHNVTKVLNQARQMYKDYIKQHATTAQQKFRKNEDC